MQSFLNLLFYIRKTGVPRSIKNPSGLRKLMLISKSKICVLKNYFRELNRILLLFVGASYFHLQEIIKVAKPMKCEKQLII